MRKRECDGCRLSRGEVQRLDEGGGARPLRLDDVRTRIDREGDAPGTRTERDPITLHGTWLMENGVATRAELDAIQEKLIAEMDSAVDFAVNAPYPDPSKVTEDVYA